MRASATDDRNVLDVDRQLLRFLYSSGDIHRRSGVSGKDGYVSMTASFCSCQTNLTVEMAHEAVGLET